MSRSESTGSSNFGSSTSMIAEDIIKEMGAPEDYSNRTCTCLHN